MARTSGMMKLNLHELGCDMYPPAAQMATAPKGSGFCLSAMNDDRLWNTMRRKDERHEDSRGTIPADWQFERACALGLRAAVQLANEIGMERIEKRHVRCGLHLKEMVKRGAESWTSPDPALRCAIAAVNVPPIQIGEIETGCGRTRRSASAAERLEDPLSTPYIVAEGCGRFLTAYDEYQTAKNESRELSFNTAKS